MLSASIVLLNLAFQIHGSDFRNGTAVKSSTAAQNVQSKPAASKAKDKPAPKTKQDKEEDEAIGGLVNGLNALEGAGGLAGAAMRRKYMDRSQALVAHSMDIATAHYVEQFEERSQSLATNSTQPKEKEDNEEKEAVAGLVNGLSKIPMRNGKISTHGVHRANLKKAVLVANASATKAIAPKSPKSKEDKDEDEAITGLVNGLNKLPMRGGKVSPVAARMANLKRKTALVSHVAPTAEEASKDAERVKRAQSAVEKAEAAEKSVEQEAAEAHKEAQSTKEALKEKKPAAVLVSRKAPPAKSNQKPTKVQSPKNEQEGKEEREGVAGLVNGLSKIPMKNGKISTHGVRMATAAQRKKSSLVSHAAPVIPSKPKDQTSKKSALLSHAAPATTTTVRPASVNAGDAEAQLNKRVQHALELADAAEASVNQDEKEAHEEAEEARKFAKSI